MLRQAADEVYAMERKEVWRESSGAPRTAFAAHTYHEAFRRLGRHPRLIGPVMQLVDGPVYMHQYKVNAKAAFDGEVWQWHQDFGTWHRDDEMPEPRAMNIAVFLDEVTAANGPLLFLPKSHRQGVFEAEHDLETTTYPLWTLDRATVTRLAEQGGMRRSHRSAGSMIVFASTLVHASAPNISPLGRSIVYLSLCHVDNHIRRFKRPSGSRTATSGPSSRSRTTASRSSRSPKRRPERAVYLRELLGERATSAAPVRVGLIGAGKFGSMFLAQALRPPGSR